MQILYTVRRTFNTFINIYMQIMMSVFFISCLVFLRFQMGKWCDDGIYMLASQPLDKCQSQEGAESALSELESYLETANEKQQWDINTVWLEYDSILNTELRVRKYEFIA